MTIGRVLGGALLAAAVTVTSGSANAENFFKLLFQGNGTFQPAGNGASLPSQYQRQSVRYNTSEKPGTIVIDTKNKFLYYVEGNGWATRYGVGVGREGFGWKGTVKIGRKAEWPTWTPPPEMRARERKKGRILPVSMEGGPQNPLGARAMYLYDGGRDTMFRIHGTSEPWTIGHNVSSGCIRMVNADVTDLYGKAGVGTKVIVR
ncbi:MAG: L,D-transpeptidase [Rhizobiales bacterium]|nr:L,D-transpeptidase [Hyphomicrobiales bacterium]